MTTEDDEKSSCHCCGYPTNDLREYPGPLMRDASRAGASLFCRVCAETFLSHAITYPQLHGGSRLLFSSLGWIANRLLDAIAEQNPEVVWQGWDLQNIPSAKGILATIPGDFSADGELLNFFYGEQWTSEARQKRLSASPTRPCLTINQLPFIYATAISKMDNPLLGDFRDLVKAWIAKQNMDAQRMYNFMASNAVERAAVVAK